MNELEKVREDRGAANANIDLLPAQLRLAALEDCAVTITVPARFIIPLAARLKRGEARPALIVIRPKTLLEDRFDWFWNRLCGCLFISALAVRAAGAACYLFGLIR